METIETRLRLRKRKLEEDHVESTAELKRHTERLSKIDKELCDVTVSLRPQNLFQQMILEEMESSIAILELLRLIAEYAAHVTQKYEWTQGSEELTARLSNSRLRMSWAYAAPPLGQLPFQWVFRFRQLPPCYDDRDNSHCWELLICLIHESEATPAIQTHGKQYFGDGPRFQSCIELVKRPSNTREYLDFHFDVNPYSPIPTVQITGQYGPNKIWSVPNLLQYRLIVVKGSESAVDIVTKE